MRLREEGVLEVVESELVLRVLELLLVLAFAVLFVGVEVAEVIVEDGRLVEAADFHEVVDDLEDGRLGDVREEVHLLEDHAGGVEAEAGLREPEVVEGLATHDDGFDLGAAAEPEVEAFEEAAV